MRGKMTVMRTTATFRLLLPVIFVAVPIQLKVNERSIGSLEASWVKDRVGLRPARYL